MMTRDRYSDRAAKKTLYAQIVGALAILAISGQVGASQAADQTWYAMNFVDHRCDAVDLRREMGQIKWEIDESRGEITARVEMFAYGREAVYRVISNHPLNGRRIQRLDVYTGSRAYCEQNIDVYFEDAKRLYKGEAMVKGGDAPLGILDMTPIMLGEQP